MQSSSFKQGQELVGKASSEQDYVKESDIDAAKVAAMKAAELGMHLLLTVKKLNKVLWVVITIFSVFIIIMF